MIASRIRSMTAPHWLALFALVFASWALLFVMAQPTELRELSAIYGSDFWAAFCTLTPDTAGFGRTVVMWVLMSAAMMAPTVLPALATYEDLGHSTEINFSALLAGYLSVWIGFSFAAAGAQMALFQAGLLSALGDSRSQALSGMLLLVAGLYQFTPLKDACLSKCRAPLSFFFAHWEEGALRNGVRLGVVCLGCCWALMTLAFVGGVMNLAFMGLATLIMVWEKMPDYGRFVTRPLGVALVTGALITLI